MIKILITGCAGFIGSSLVDRLLNLGFSVVGIDNLDTFYDKSIKLQNLHTALKSNYFKFIHGDILQPELVKEIIKVENVNLVVHLAAKAGVRPSILDPAAYYLTNVQGTLTVLEAMRENGINKIIFASSSSVYGNNPKVPFSEEDSVDHPISPYAATKKAGELLCYTYHHLYRFDVFCLRFFTVYGPRQRPDLAIHKFTDIILDENEIPVFGDGSTRRDYTYIDDILDGILSAIRNVSGYEIINLGESRTIRLDELLHLLSVNLNKKLNIKKLPLQAGDVDITYADISKAKRLLNYQPNWGFEDGLHAFLNWKLDK